MISLLEFFGNATEVVTTTAITLDLRYRFWRIKTTTSSLTMKFPAISVPGLPQGGLVFIVANVGTSPGDKTFSLQPTEGGTSVPLETGEVCLVSGYAPGGSFAWAYQPLGTSLLTYQAVGYTP